MIPSADINASPSTNAVSKENELKNICGKRLLCAFGYTIAMQYLLLTIFLLFVNFNILHPFVWVKQSISLLFSFYTWFWTIPLIFLIIINGVVIGRQFLVTSQYYHSRMIYFVNNFVKKITLIAVNALIGILTTSLYIGYLGEGYNAAVLADNKQRFLNEKYIFLIMTGLFMGVYYSIKNKLTDYRISFPVIHQSKYLLVRSTLYKTLIASLYESIFPLMIYVGCYFLTGQYLMQKSSMISGISFKSRTIMDSIYFILTDFRLIFYMWLLGSQILSNMNLMIQLFNIFLTEYYQFEVDKIDASANNMANDVITLADALSFKDLEITMQWAARDLYLLSENSEYNVRRRAFYKLSLPGGHPHNWNKLSGECLKLITNFTKELKESIDNINVQEKKQNNQNNNDLYKPNATILAEKIIFSRYNEESGIRNITNYSGCVQDNLNSSTFPIVEPKTPNQTVQWSVQKVSEVKFFMKNKIPAVKYLFCEVPEGRTYFLLTSRSQTIMWVAQGLASLCKHSIVEDNFGVVQDDLPTIIKTLIQLKLILDKVGTLNFAGQRDLNYNFIRLRNAVKRSIYQILTAFSNYINDIPIDSNDLNIVHSFMKYKEI